MKRSEATQWKRFKVLHRDGFRCVYCGAGSDTVTLHVDHVVPLSRGGTSAFDNLATACTTCNAGKSNSEITTSPPPRSPDVVAAGVLAHRARPRPPPSARAVEDGPPPTPSADAGAMIAALRDACLPTKEKIVLAMLMSRARPIQDEGWVCWPSLPVMALDTGLAERSITRTLASLGSLGLVAIDRGTGRTVSRYVLDYHAIVALPPDPRRLTRKRAQ